MTAHQPDLMPQPAPSTPPAAMSDEARAVWRARLAEALRDAALRSTPGFPIADDAAILALSDPPYYTACPNPFLAEIVAGWQAERSATRAALGLPDDGENGAANGYHREPFAADVSEGKNNPIYNAHSYHTKVPHPAIMRYILHYTDPGDVVFDGFCGTGMTGVAAQLCGDAGAVRSLGYRVDKDGWVWDGEQRISRLGARKAVLNDLSPAATFIAYNYNTPVDAAAFEREATRILKEVEAECGWMYETLHTDGKTKGRINFTVWSDVFACPQCGAEMTFWDVAVDQVDGKVLDDWVCPGCGVRLSKNPKKESGAQRAERVLIMSFDRSVNQTVRQVKQVPVLINYYVGKRRYEKRPDVQDMANVAQIENDDIPYPYPTQAMMLKGGEWGDTWRAGYHAGMTHVTHFYSRRNLWILAVLYGRIGRLEKPHRLSNFLLVWFTSSHSRLHKLNRYMPEHNRHVGPLSGTLYISSTPVEISPFTFARAKMNDHTRIPELRGGVILTNQSSNNLSGVVSDSLDYIFVDPPFGGNLMYSELNFLWEAWLGVLTNNTPEAVVNQTQRKALPDYQRLMEACFAEFYRVLKPGRWMTVEFHNSANAVWNSIQEAILRAGFMVADVRTLDKEKGTTKQLTYHNATKQDLIISAYKPATAFVRQFELQAGTAEGAWAFVRQHLAQLPVVVLKQGVVEPLAERMPYLLFDRMVAFHIQRGLTVPLAAADFYAGLEQRFVPRDGMIFLPDQTPEYDRARLAADGVGQLALFVNDEKSARQWLRRALDPEQGGTPQSYADLQPGFLKQLHTARHEAMPELGELLEENFLQEADGRWRLPDPRRAADLEALRQKALLREFRSYQQGSGRLKQFRSEAVRAGFADAYRQRDWPAILKVAGRLPESVLQEDPDLLMYYDAASLRAR